MVRRLILATSVAICLSNHCAADAVRKVRIVDPVGAKKQEREKQLQAFQQNLLRSKERVRLLSDLIELSTDHAHASSQLLRESDPEIRSQLRVRIEELDEKIQRLQQTFKNWRN